MIVVCRSLSQRQKNYKKYFYCKKKKCKINLQECRFCNKKHYKNYNPIKKVSKKKINVTQQTYDYVYERDKGLCRLCKNNNIQLHHIIYRSEDKSKINDVDNCIMLCDKCHRKVHTNKKYWQPYLQQIIYMVNNYEN